MLLDELFEMGTGGRCLMATKCLSVQHRTLIEDETGVVAFLFAIPIRWLSFARFSVSGSRYFSRKSRNLVAMIGPFINQKIHTVMKKYGET